MDILGKWRLKEIETLEFVDDKPKKVVKSRAQLAEDPDFAYFANATYEFTADGKFSAAIPLPEGTNVDELSDEEKACIVNGMYVMQSQPWKEENGKFLIDSGQHREVLGEVLSSWDEIVVNADGTITVNGMFPMTYER